MVHAIPLRQFYPFGIDAGDSVLPRFDDGVSDAIPLLPGFRYFGSSYTNIYVSFLHVLLFIDVSYSIQDELYCSYSVTDRVKFC
jgi:hypothetical protein